MQGEILSDRDSFETWLAHMEDALEEFFDKVPEAVRPQLDYSPVSLDVLEVWLLELYGSPDEFRADYKFIWDGAARYVGQTFRQSLGGIWTVKLDDPKYAFFGIPVLTGFKNEYTSLCPHTLVTAATDRRTGRYLKGILTGKLKEKGK